MNNKTKNNYDPKLPTNIIDCSFNNKISDGIVNYKRCMKGGARYNPTLPTNIIEEKEIVTNYDKNHKTKEKITMGDAWNGTIFRSFNNKYNPKLPLNIIEENEIIQFSGNGSY